LSTNNLPVICEILSKGRYEFDAGISREVYTSQVSGGVGVVDSEDAGVEGEGGQVGEGEAVGGAAQGGDVAEVMDELPAEHGIEFAFDE
jgi:hypothetical protein